MIKLANQMEATVLSTNQIATLKKRKNGFETIHIASKFHKCFNRN